ncbi:hypothetical protein OEZ85_005203 [Tetradesmus obliquus]|uniref:Uncharacterized protein n=1 Tax=Tetradesmus obliquus TaxID=3088 RepID=A0ABY8UII3_TETOB|nr:hypothetical protein OEZ85_005203 [Tetradesmus obliquus]
MRQEFPDRATEQRYLSWKHASLLHLDYGAVVFCAFYLLTLLRRMLSEPTTFFYLVYMLVKTAPHVPLALGLQQTYLRHREQWLLLVAPTTALVAICLALPAVARGQPPMLLPNRAYRAYWTGRGELPTGILRPFLQHMRVRSYAVYALIDAAVTAWVLGQVFGVWAAVRRLCFAAAMSIGLCWGLELHMRRRFVEALARQQQQQQQQQQMQMRQQQQMQMRQQQQQNQPQAQQ